MRMIRETETVTKSELEILKYEREEQNSLWLTILGGGFYLGRVFLGDGWPEPPAGG